MSIPSLPGSIMTDFGRNLQEHLNVVLGPIQQQLSTSDDLKETIFREVIVPLYTPYRLFHRFS